MPKARNFGAAVVVAAVVVAALVPSSAMAAELTVVGQFGNGVGPGPGQFSNPDDLATDSAGFVYVADGSNNRIQKFTPDGQFLDEFGTSGSDAGELTTANGVAVDSAGNVYVADRGNARVMQFDSAGTFVQGWGWSVDSAADAFEVCTPASLCEIGTAVNSSVKAGGFSTPQTVAVDAADNVYVSDFSGDQQIQKFDPGPLGSVAFLTGWGSPGSANGQFARPAGLAFDSTPNVFVADRDNSRVQKFTSTGSFLTTIASDGPGDGQVDSAKDVAVDAAGNVFVADPINSRIQKFTNAGAFLTTYTLPPPDFVAPAALTFSPQGDLYVIDSASGHNFRILRLREPAVQPPPGGLPAPVLGKSVNVRVVSGTVLIGVPGGGSARAAQKGVQFEPLSEARQIPVGSFLDTKRGRVRLTSAADAAATLQSGTFAKGLFQVLQARSGKDRGITDLRLKGSSFRRSCRAGAGGGRASAARKRLSSRTVRLLHANAEGSFRSRGRHSSATVRGTVWITTDRCDGTLTRVRRGRVAVRDFRRKRTITVRAGKRYLARAG